MKIGIITPNRNGGADAFPAGPFDPDQFRGRIPLDEESREGLECAFRRRNRVQNGARSDGRHSERSQCPPNSVAKDRARKMRLFPAICESAALSVAHPLQTTIHPWG